VQRVSIRLHLSEEALISRLIPASEILFEIALYLCNDFIINASSLACHAARKLRLRPGK
jgi:hypothetical protein